MRKDDEPMPFNNAQDIMLKSLLRDGMTWSEAKKSIKFNPNLQKVLVELRRGAKDD